MSSEKKLKSDAESGSSRSLADVLVSGILHLILSFTNLKERALFGQTCKILGQASRHPASLVPFVQYLTPLLRRKPFKAGIGAHALQDFRVWTGRHNNPPLRAIRLQLPILQDLPDALAVVLNKFKPSLKLLQLAVEADTASNNWISTGTTAKFLVSDLHQLQWLQLGWVAEHGLSETIARMPNLRGLVVVTPRTDWLTPTTSTGRFFQGLELLSITMVRTARKRWVKAKKAGGWLRRHNSNMRIKFDWSKSRLKFLLLRYPVQHLKVTWCTGQPLPPSIAVNDPKTAMTNCQFFPFHLYFPECSDFGMK